MDQAADQGDARLLNGRALNRLLCLDRVTAGQLVVPLSLGQLFVDPHVVDFEVGGRQIEHRSVLPSDFCLAGASLAMHASWRWGWCGTSGDPRNHGTEMRGGEIRAGLRTFPDGLDEVFAGGEGGGFRPVAHAELGDQVGDMGLDRARADVEGFGDFAV